jgi:protein disulfide isomerase family A protein 3
VASALRESATFGHAPSSSKGKGIVLYRPAHLQSKLESKEVPFGGKIDKDAVSSWIKENYHGLVGHRTTSNSGDFKEPLVVAYFAVDYVKNAKGTNYWRNRILKVAKAFEGKLNFGISNANDFQVSVLFSAKTFFAHFIIKEFGQCFIQNKRQNA